MAVFLKPLPFSLSRIPSPTSVTLSFFSFCSTKRLFLPHAPHFFTDQHHLLNDRSVRNRTALTNNCNRIGMKRKVLWFRHWTDSRQLGLILSSVAALCSTSSKSFHLPVVRAAICHRDTPCFENRNKQGHPSCRDTHSYL